MDELSWSMVHSCRGSSETGFPIKDAWQTCFYSAIGHYIPAHLTFCKERVVGSKDRVDFVLRNGSTRGVEFLIKSDRVEKHHKRFETGAYSKLNLDDYIVVDILPWSSEVPSSTNKRSRDVHDVSHDERTSFASGLFQKLALARRQKHAVFVVANNDLARGFLFTYDKAQGKAVVATWSPRT